MSIKDSTEIDFLTDSGVLIEAKYRSELSDAQKRLFESFKAKQKIIISGIEDVQKHFL